MVLCNGWLLIFILLSTIDCACSILDETLGKFTSLTDSVVEDNEVGSSHTAKSGPKKGTRATLTAVVPAGKVQVIMDFSEALVLSPAVGIAEARCWLSGPSPAGLTTEILGENCSCAFFHPAPGCIM